MNAHLVLDDGLPDMDLDGYEFRILANYWGNAPAALTYVLKE